MASTLVDAYQKVNCLMSVKLNYIDAHLDKFPANCGLSGEEIGEQFHQVNQKTREKLPNQHLVKDFLVDYNRSLKSESNIKFKKSSNKELIL